MPKQSREYLESLWARGAAGDCLDSVDFDWYARDESGHVAFIASGGAEVPRCIFRDLDTYVSLKTWLDSLPEAGKSDLLIRYPNVSDFTSAANRGLFAFNFDDDKSRNAGFHLVSRPHNPLRIESLPDWATKWLNHIWFSSTRFADITTQPLDLSQVKSRNE